MKINNFFADRSGATFTRRPSQRLSGLRIAVIPSFRLIKKNES